MGQKTNPIGNRLGFIHGWDSNWYGGSGTKSKDNAEKIVEDDKIRKYLFTRLSKASISKVIIERTLKLVTVTVNTARPGVIIGKGGQEVDKLKEELKKLTKKEIQINIFEVKRPELDAHLVAEGISILLELFSTLKVKRLRVSVAIVAFSLIRGFLIMLFITILV